LTTVEQQVDVFRQERAKKQEEIEKRIRQQLDEAQANLNVAAKKIEEDQSLSLFEKLQQASQEASSAQRRFDLQKEQLDKDLKLEIDRLQSEEQQRVSSLENRIRGLSVFLAPLPALLLGVIVLMVRTSNERRHISDARRAD
jgi:ABC-2 type transport system permease protein